MTKAAAALLAGLVAALTLAMFVASSVAAKEVAPVAERVTRLEEQRTADKATLQEVRDDVKAILRELRTPPPWREVKGGR